MKNSCSGSSRNWRREDVSLLGRMLATVKSMQAPTKEERDELYLMSLEEPMSTPIV